MEENNSFDFSSVWRIIKRYFKWLIIFPVAGLLLSVLLTLFVAQPKYEATSQVLIEKSDKGDLTMAEKYQADSQIVATYTDIAESPRVLGKVAEEIGKGEDVNTMTDKVKVSNQPNSQVLNFTATANSEKAAVKIADTAAEVLKKEVHSLSPDSGIEILSKSKDDVKEISLSLVKNALLGLIAGLIVIVILILIREFLNQSKSTSKRNIHNTP